MTGQAKKKYGSKSAKAYAPGQRKKNYSVYDHRNNNDWKSKGKNKKRKD